MLFDFLAAANFAEQHESAQEIPKAQLHSIVGILSMVDSHFIFMIQVFVITWFLKTQHVLLRIMKTKHYLVLLRYLLFDYHRYVFRSTYQPLQSTTPSSKYHIALFKVPHNPLQNTTQPSSKYHTTLFKVSHHPLQSTTSKHHPTLRKVPHHPLQSITSL